MEKKIVGYKLDGTILYEQKGFGTMVMLYCEGCKKPLANTGGKTGVYCQNCASSRGIVTEKNRK